MQIYIIIINYNGANDTIECLTSLENEENLDIKVMLVDNCSKTEDRNNLEKWLKSIRKLDLIYLKTDSNLGFAGGNNFALRRIQDKPWDYVLLLNNDTVIEKGSLNALIREAEIENADLAGPKILYYDDPKTIWHGAGYYSFLRQGPHVPELNQLDKGDEKPVSADFLTGCALLISRKAFRLLGFLDEKYFFIQEDWDYCFTAKKLNMKLLYVPAAHIRHKVSRSSGGWFSSFSLYHQGKGRSYFIRKHYKGVNKVFHWFYLLTFISLVKNMQIVQGPGTLVERITAKPISWWSGCWAGIFK